MLACLLAGPGRRRHLETLIITPEGTQHRSGGVGMGCLGLWICQVKIRRRRRCGIRGGGEGGIGGDGGGREDERDRGDVMVENGEGGSRVD